MATPKLRSHRLLVIMLLASVPACSAQDAPATFRPTADPRLSKIFVDPREPTDWNDPQWNTREAPNPGCNGAYRTSQRDVSLQELASHPLKTIHVTPYRLNANTPSKKQTDIRQQVLEVWLGKFRTAFCQIAWAEGTNCYINATVKFDDSRRGSLLTDGSHVRLLGHDGKIWFLRLLPAAQ